MFPDWFNNGVCSIACGTSCSVKWLYSFSRSAVWIIVTTSAIIAAPAAFELERAQMDEMQKQQQRQILLGPGAASGGALAPPPPPIPRM